MTDQEHIVELWYADDNEVTANLVKAYQRDGDSYWVPSKGSMATKGYRVFDTRPEAVAKVRSVVSGRLAQAQTAMAKAEKL